MRKIIRTDDLTMADIPDLSAGWYEMSMFALTFDPMLELGTTDIYKIELFNFNPTRAKEKSLSLAKSFELAVSRYRRARLPKGYTFADSDQEQAYGRFSAPLRPR